MLGFALVYSGQLILYIRKSNNGLPIYTYGPIIHNEEVVEDLEKKGVRVIETLEELKDLPKGTIIIRSHGISRKSIDETFLLRP